MKDIDELLNEVRDMADALARLTMFKFTPVTKVTKDTKDSPDDIEIVYKSNGMKGYLQSADNDNNMELVERALAILDTDDDDGLYIAKLFNADKRLSLSLYGCLKNVAEVGDIDEDDEPCKGEPKFICTVIKDVNGKCGIRTDFTVFNAPFTSRLKCLIGQAVLLDGGFGSGTVTEVRVFRSPGGSIGISTENKEVTPENIDRAAMIKFHTYFELECFSSLITQLQLEPILRETEIAGPYWSTCCRDNALDIMTIIDQIRFIGSAIHDNGDSSETISDDDDNVDDQPNARVLTVIRLNGKDKFGVVEDVDDIIKRDPEFFGGLDQMMDEMIGDNPCFVRVNYGDIVGSDDVKFIPLTIFKLRDILG